MYQILITWAQGQLSTYAVEKGCDKFLGFLKMDPVVVAINTSIERTGTELNIETANYLLRKVFGKNKKLFNLIKGNYRTNPATVLSAISDGLSQCDADFGEETENKINEIGSKFMDCLIVEIPKRENVPVSSTQTTEAILKQTQSNGQMLQKILERTEKQDKAFDSVDNTKRDIPAEIPSRFLKDNTPEVNDSKYKADIDAAKVLLDKGIFDGAQAIYEKLIELFKTDTNVPIILRFKAYNNLGSCFVGLGKRREASINFKIAFDIIGPTSLIACKNRALACLFDGIPLDGIPYIDAAIAINPDDNDSIDIKANLFSAAGQPDKAIELYMDKDV